MNQKRIDSQGRFDNEEEETYQALRRGLQRKSGFGLFFVRCIPANVATIVGRIREDIPNRKVELLNLEGEIEHFYDFVRENLDYDNIDILFVTGIEKSLIDYIKPGIGGEGDYYNMDTVPQILGHFNLYRETLRKDFKIEFVFILPLFAYKYFIRRAPDFFDWHSGIVEFNTDSEKLERVAARVIAEGDYKKYLSWSDRDRKQKIFELKDLIGEANQTEENKLSLFLELGNILVADRQYEEAIASYDKAVEINPNYDAAWYNRGVALYNLGRYEEAIASYDKAVEINPNYDAAWYNRGNAWL
ncbi:MAG: tetratricopeptide repeat protein [Spirulina sp.]